MSWGKQKTVFSDPSRLSIHINCWSEHGTCWTGFQIMEWVQREQEEIGKRHGCSCSRLQLSSYCGLMFPHLKLLRLSRLHGAVPQGHLANIRPFHEAGMISETTVFLGKYQLAGACRLVLSVLNKNPQDPSRKVMTTPIMPNGQVYCTAVGHIPSSLETRQYHVIYMKLGKEQKAWTKELLPGNYCLHLPSESQHQHGNWINAGTISTALHKRDGIFLESD